MIIQNSTIQSHFIVTSDIDCPEFNWIKIDWTIQLLWLPFSWWESHQNGHRWYNFFNWSIHQICLITWIKWQMNIQTIFNMLCLKEIFQIFNTFQISNRNLNSNSNSNFKLGFMHMKYHVLYETIQSLVFFYRNAMECYFWKQIQLLIQKNSLQNLVLWNLVLIVPRN